MLYFLFLHPPSKFKIYNMTTVLNIFWIRFLFVNMVTYIMHVDITKLHVDFIILHDALTL